MSKPIVYLDQNIIGLMLDGVKKATEPAEFSWVYSTEHFAEFSRASEPEKFVTVLERIGAKLLRLKLDTNLQITGESELIAVSTPHQHYTEYVEAVEGMAGSDSLFDPLIVWLNGGSHERVLKQLPDNLHREMHDLAHGNAEVSTTILSRLQNLNPEFDLMIDNLIKQGNDIGKTRVALGGGKGAFGCVTEENQIQQIWNMIAPKMKNISCDQFFGFEPPEQGNQDNWPIYLGIIGCCSVLDIIGYASEKKSRDISNLPNVRSDAMHIALGAFCSAIVSNDKRLVKRASAIYQYKNLSAGVMHVDV